MKFTDQDGKSKTSSAVDVRRYPEQNEVDARSVIQTPDREHDDIAERAYELWTQRGCPIGSPERDWFEAEEQLRAGRNSQKTRKPGARTGSVQA